MAKEIPGIERSILTPTSDVRASNSFARMGEASGQLAQTLTKPVAEAAIDYASTKAEMDVANGKAPKNLMPGFTPATRAYNKAVSDTEARRMVSSAREQIEQALLEDTNPAKFNSSTPATFNAKIDGIMQGTLEHARDENREQITQALSSLRSHASSRMLSHAISYDNKKVANEFKDDISSLSRQRSNAALAGDIEQVKAINESLQETINDYSTMNEQVKLMAPHIKEKLAQQEQVDEKLSSFAQALAEGKEEAWLADFAQNKDKMPADLWQETSQKALQISSTQKRLSAQMNGAEYAEVNRGIETGDINNYDQLEQYTTLTIPQKLAAKTRLDTTQLKMVKAQADINEAMRDITTGQSAKISGNTKDKMLQQANKEFENATGRAPSLAEQGQSITGTNMFPASGIPMTGMSTNVPEFDAQISAALTSKDPAMVANAAMVYNNMVNLNEQPNSVDISGEALSAATMFNSLNQGGISPEQAAALTVEAINPTDPAKKERSERYKRMVRVDQNGLSKVSQAFKETFGTKVKDFDTDAAYNTFKDIYRAHYVNSGSEEAALSAAKYTMRSYGTSDFFPSGLVAQPVPEKELNITKLGNTFNNQIKAGLQAFINRNNKLSEQGVKVQNVEWKDKSNQIDLDDIKESDKVFGELGGTKGLPKLVVDGVETEIKLVPTPYSRMGDKISYSIGYYDRFNNLQILQDPTNEVHNMATFVPMGLESWAPGVLEGKEKDRLETLAKNIIKQERTSGHSSHSLHSHAASLGWSNMGNISQVIDDMQSNRITKEEVDKVLRRRIDTGSVKETTDKESVPEMAAESSMVGLKDIGE